jgi:phage gpG-like protein
MSKYRLEFEGDKITRAIFEELHRRVTRCAILVWNAWKKLLSVEGAGVGANGSLKYGANPSKPGEPPRKQRGRLLASAAWEVVKLVARVGSNLGYARVLELGGKDVRPRPSLRRAVKECQGQIQSILSAPMKGP